MAWYCGSCVSLRWLGMAVSVRGAELAVYMVMEYRSERRGFERFHRDASPATLPEEAALTYERARVSMA